MAVTPVGHAFQPQASDNFEGSSRPYSTRMSGRRDPFRDIEELFERMSAGFGGVGEELETELGGNAIHVDVADADGDVVVTADVPGFDKGDIDVTVDDRRLSIVAEADTETERESGEEETHYYRRERATRKTSRTLTLPVDVDETGASATYENGVLTVTLPKAGAGEEGHSIDID